MATAKDVTALAAGEIGVSESPAGSNTVRYNTEYYGRKVSGGAYPWCVVFLWWVFRQAGASGLFYGGGKTASCGTLRSYAKRHGQWVTADYRPGDILIYDFSGKQSAPEHAWSGSPGAGGSSPSRATPAPRTPATAGRCGGAPGG